MSLLPDDKRETLDEGGKPQIFPSLCAGVALLFRGRVAYTEGRFLRFFRPEEGFKP